MSKEFWPHLFTKSGVPKKIGEEKVFDNTTRSVLAQEMICVHCDLKFIHNVDPRPGGSCPGRNTKKEMKRLLNK